MKTNLERMLSLALVLATIAGCAEQSTPEATEGFVGVEDGLHLYYRSYGEGDEALVLLHGGPGMSFVGVGPDLLQLADQRRLVMYDQRGGGWSDPDPNAEYQTAETHVQDLEAVRLALGLESLTLIGHSWGCPLAALYAAQYPEHVERLLLIGPMEPSRALWDLRFDVQRQFLQAADAELERLAQSGQPAADSCRMRMDVVQRFYYHDELKMASKRGDYCEVPEGVPAYNDVIGNAVLDALGDYDLQPLLAGLEMPALVIEGAQSPLPLDGEYAWAQSLPNARLWLLDQVGHAYPFVEAPGVFFPGVERFLNGDWPDGAVSISEDSQTN